MAFGANKTPIAVIKEGAFGGACFRDIYSGINGKCYRKSWREFNKLKKLTRNAIVQISINEVNCGTSLRIWGKKGWFQWYFRFG